MLIRPLLLLCFLAFNAAGEDGLVGFESDRWEIQGGQTAEYLGRKCFRGRAVLKDVEFENGVIEVDMAFKGPRCFVGLAFRMESDQGYENVYIRPHKSNAADTIQYTPVFRGQSGWQLYNGPGFTAMAEVPHEQWMHVRLEVAGTQARLFLDGATEPALVINDLKRGCSKGWIGVEGPTNGLGYFADFRYRADDSLELPPAPPAEEQPGMLRDWEISEPYRFFEVDYESHPDAQELADPGWRKVDPEPCGIVNIARFVAKLGREPAVIFARTTLKAEEPHTMELNFGYSDSAFVYLNGKRMFKGINSYRSRDGNYLGAVTLYDSIYLPLEKGDNELMLTVIDAFGGWGFICQNGSYIYADESLSQAWQVTGCFNQPESVVHDPKRGVLYVSNFGQFVPPGSQTLSRVTLDGKVDGPEWVTGLTMPLGSVIHDDKLYVAERRCLAEIDIEKAAVTNRFMLPGADNPNDVTVDGAGDFYVSDTRRHVIYKVSGGKAEVWLSGDEVGNPNGVLVDGGKLIWANNADGALKSVDLATKDVRTVAVLGPGIMDGIVPDGKGNYLVSIYEGKLLRVTPDGQTTVLLDTRAKGLPLTNFDYIADKGLIVIPTLNSNSVVAYRIKE